MYYVVEQVEQQEKRGVEQPSELNDHTADSYSRLVCKSVPSLKGYFVCMTQLPVVDFLPTYVWWYLLYTLKGNLLLSEQKLEYMAYVFRTVGCYSLIL